VRILHLLEHLDVVELDVEVLVDALEDAADLDVVLELDRDLVVDERLEEAVFGVGVARPRSACFFGFRVVFLVKKVLIGGKAEEIK
jgi:hypothetical protein